MKIKRINISITIKIKWKNIDRWPDKNGFLSLLPSTLQFQPSEVRCGGSAAHPPHPLWRGNGKDDAHG